MSLETEEGRKSGSMSRRSFGERAGLGAVAALAGHARFQIRNGIAAGAPPIAFNTANLVARVSGYRFELKNWMGQHLKTIDATDAAVWRAICREIAGAGFKTVEVWEAHASPQRLDQAARAMEWKSALRDAGLQPVAYAGSLSAETARICEWLEIPHVDGGLGRLSPEQATALCKQTGIRFNYENHPEKSAEDILKKVGGGNEWLGVCVDTGWLATQGVPGPEAIKTIGSFVRHTHIKDVKRIGAHETCLLGEGVANVAACIDALRSIRYTGSYSWEDEPEDRNPFESARQNLQWIRRRVS
jgi:sugar phosphate isomerase/epimerase